MSIPNHATARREPQLSLADENHLPSLVLLPPHHGVLAVGTEPFVSSPFSLRARQAFVAAGSAVFLPSARLEMPAAEGPDSSFAAFSSTWAV
jgi:hypothetical protein